MYQIESNYIKFCEQFNDVLKNGICLRLNLIVPNFCKGRKGWVSLSEGNCPFRNFVAAVSANLRQRIVRRSRWWHESPSRLALHWATLLGATFARGKLFLTPLSSILQERSASWLLPFIFEIIAAEFSTPRPLYCHGFVPTNCSLNFIILRNFEPWNNYYKYSSVIILLNGLKLGLFWLKIRSSVYFYVFQNNYRGEDSIFR